MLEVGRETDLALEAFSAERCGEIRVQDLERYRPLVLDVAREVDGGHPAVPKLALDLVAAREGFTEAGQNFRHRAVGFGGGRGVLCPNMRFAADFTTVKLVAVRLVPWKAHSAAAARKCLCGGTLGVPPANGAVKRVPHGSFCFWGLTLFPEFELGSDPNTTL